MTFTARFRWNNSSSGLFIKPPFPGDSADAQGKELRNKNRREKGFTLGPGVVKNPNKPGSFPLEKPGMSQRGGIGCNSSQFLGVALPNVLHFAFLALYYPCSAFKMIKIVINRGEARREFKSSSSTFALLNCWENKTTPKKPLLCAGWKRRAAKNRGKRKKKFKKKPSDKILIIFAVNQEQFWVALNFVPLGLFQNEGITRESLS